MPGSWLAQDHPYLTEDNCTVTSPSRNAYNCIAWAAGDDTRWWWPTPLRGINYWPRGVPREVKVEAFILAFGTIGYAPCADGSLEPGIEKIAMFAKRMNGELVPTHAALQLESGEWTSKMGRLEDIVHALVGDVGGPVYGQTVRYLARPRRR
jgi:hypothetical protein